MLPTKKKESRDQEWGEVNIEISQSDAVENQTQLKPSTQNEIASEVVKADGRGEKEKKKRTFQDKEFGNAKRLRASNNGTQNNERERWIISAGMSEAADHAVA